MTLVDVKDQHPKPHRRYLVKRDGQWFVATPCYGMHSPWWVAAGPEREAEPVNMKDGDLWVALDDVFNSVAIR